MAVIYKYFNSNIASKLQLDKENLGIKCSFLSDYNDPYEFYLAIDFEQSSDFLAYYENVSEMISGRMVTCFAKSPIITPMWAHYSNNLDGFVIEFDEELLNNYLNSQGTDFLFEDVDYRDIPDKKIENMLAHAHGTLKPRHLHFALQALFRGAYFTKQTCWAYEQERRLVLDNKIIRQTGTIHILPIPMEIIKSIIVGPKIDSNAYKTLESISCDLGCGFYTMRIGKSTLTPFFTNNLNNTFIFSNSEIQICNQYCPICIEPVKIMGNKCFWCSITDDDREEALYDNTFRVLHTYGLLEDLLENYKKIEKNK